MEQVSFTFALGRAVGSGLAKPFARSTMMATMALLDEEGRRQRKNRNSEKEHSRD